MVMGYVVLGFRGEEGSDRYESGAKFPSICWRLWVGGKKKQNKNISPSLADRKRMSVW